MSLRFRKFLVIVRLINKQLQNYYYFLDLSNSWKLILLNIAQPSFLLSKKSMNFNSNIFALISKFLFEEYSSWRSLTHEFPNSSPFIFLAKFYNLFDKNNNFVITTTKILIIFNKLMKLKILIPAMWDTALPGTLTR